MSRSAQPLTSSNSAARLVVGYLERQGHDAEPVLRTSGLDRQLALYLFWGEHLRDHALLAEVLLVHGAELLRILGCGDASQGLFSGGFESGFHAFPIGWIGAYRGGWCVWCTKTPRQGRGASEFVASLRGLS